MYKPIEDLNLLSRDLSALKADGFETIEQLTKLSESELLKKPSMTRARLSQIKEHLHAQGYELTNKETK